MTGEQARQTIDIVLSDQRVEVLTEVKRVIEEQRREAMDATPSTEMAELAHLERINTLDALDARIDTLMKRG